MAGTTAVTTANFDEVVLKSTTPVLVDFWAEWCNPCKVMLPILEQLAAENSSLLKVVKVNTDDNSGLAAELHIRSIPTLMLFSNGKVVHTITGAKPLPALIAELSDFVEGM